MALAHLAGKEPEVVLAAEDHRSGPNLNSLLFPSAIPPLSLRRNPSQANLPSPHTRCCRLHAPSTLPLLLSTHDTTLIRPVTAVPSNPNFRLSPNFRNFFSLFHCRIGRFPPGIQSKRTRSAAIIATLSSHLHRIATAILTSLGLRYPTAAAASKTVIEHTAVPFASQPSSATTHHLPPTTHHTVDENRNLIPFDLGIRSTCTRGRAHRCSVLFRYLSLQCASPCCTNHQKILLRTMMMTMLCKTKTRNTTLHKTCKIKT